MAAPLRLLLVEDDPNDAELILRELRRAMVAVEWQRVDTEAAFLAALDSEPDVVLSDYQMPAFDGLRALQLLQVHRPHIPFIIISGTIGEDLAVAAMRAGAADYLLKDRLTRLSSALEQAVEKSRLYRERGEQAAMLDQAHDAIIIRDLQTRKITYWNRGAERLYGWTAAEAIGRDIAELIFVEGQILADIGQKLLETGEWRGENSHRSKAGRTLIVRGHATLIPDGRSTAKSVLVINFDVTQEKELEAQMLRAQRLESIGTLAAGVAHDLNNILAPIMMSAPLLRRELPEDQRESLVATIEQSAARGAQIIRQVLAFGRGVEGERTAVTFGPLLTELQQILGETFPKSIVLECSSDANLWPVIGDATQFHQVLLNLSVNARDAMPAGGTLRLHAANTVVDESFASMLAHARPGPFVEIEVTDTGTGIAPELLERIFDPFFTTKEVGKGTGLGLSTVFGIVRSHGGFLRTSSSVGQGTRFQVFLPAATTGDAATTQAPTLPPPLGRGEVVLLVDDEETVLATAERVLRGHGYEVLRAEDGIQALALFALNRDRIAVVITDVMMPKMDGLALVRALRKMEPALPLLAMTGLDETIHQADLHALRVTTILDKPFGAHALLTALHGALRK